MKSVVRIGANRKGRRQDFDQAVPVDRPQIDARAELIQALIPIGLEVVNELLQQEVVSLVGARYSRGEGDYVRWGRQQGSVYLGDQKVAVTVPRVRNLRRGQEVPLASYQALGRPKRAEEAALLKLLKGCPVATTNPAWRRQWRRSGWRLRRCRVVSNGPAPRSWRR